MATSEPERWMPIPDWIEFYEASSLGRIKSLDRETVMLSRRGTPTVRRHAGRILVPSTDVNKGNRKSVELCANGRKRRVFVHRLVLAAFVGIQIDDNMHAAHWDGDASNNRLDNLRWATPATNAADKVRHGRQVCGEACHQAKLSAADVKMIRGPLRAVPSKVVSKQFGVSHLHINRLRHGQDWGHVA